MPGTGQSASAVAVVAVGADRQIASAIAHDLTAGGVNAVVSAAGDLQAAKSVMVITEAAVRDPDWCRAVENLGAGPIAPVAVGQIDDSCVPDRLRRLNWIIWTPADAARCLADIHVALRSDVSRYRLHRTLQAEATAWDVAGRPEYLLIGTAPRAREAAGHLRAAHGDGLATPTPLITAYVAASTRQTRREKRRQWRRWSVRAVIAGLVVILAVTVATTLRNAGRSNNLSALGNAAPWMIENRPDRIGMLSAGVLLVDGFADADLARYTLLRSLSEPWSSGILGAAHPSRLVGAAVGGDGRRTLTVDGDGALTAWDNATLEVVWRRTLPGAGQSGVLDADPDLAVVAVGGGRILHIVRIDPWQVTAVPLSADVLEVALAPTAGRVLVRTTDGLLSVGVDGGPPRELPVDGKVLDLQQSADGGVLMLLRNGEKLVVADPLTERVVSESRREQHRFEVAAVGGDGAVAWTGPDRQLHVGRALDDMHPTGRAVPDILEVLEVLPGGRVAYGGAQFGVRLFDDRAGADVGEICRSLVDVGALAVSPGGDVAGCVNYYVVDLWRTKAMSPLGEAPNLPGGVADVPSGSGAGVQVTGSTDGTITLTDTVPDPDPAVWRVDGTPITVVMGGERGMAVGTTGGAVVQYALGDGSGREVGRWITPDGSSITGIAADPDRPEHLVVRTAAGNWWTIPSCLSCSADLVLVQEVRSRLWGCYTANQVEELTDDARDQLGIVLCRPSPPAEDVPG